MARKTRKTLVEVTWVDPTIHSGWVEKEHEEPLPRFRSYGILISKTKEEIKIAHGIGQNKDMCDVSRFPKGCVLNVRTIEEWAD